MNLDALLDFSLSFLYGFNVPEFHIILTTACCFYFNCGQSPGHAIMAVFHPRQSIFTLIGTKAKVVLWF